MTHILNFLFLNPEADFLFTLFVFFLLIHSILRVLFHD